MGISGGYSLVHRKKNCEFTFHSERREKKKEGKDSVKKMSTGPNPVKRKEKWRIKPKNRIHPLSMPNGKKKINIRMEAPFGDSKDMGKCVPYIFLHNFTGEGRFLLR